MASKRTESWAVAKKKNAWGHQRRDSIGQHVARGNGGWHAREWRRPAHRRRERQKVEANSLSSAPAPPMLALHSPNAVDASKQRVAPKRAVDGLVRATSFRASADGLSMLRVLCLPWVYRRGRVGRRACVDPPVSRRARGRRPPQRVHMQRFET